MLINKLVAVAAMLFFVMPCVVVFDAGFLDGLNFCGV